MIFEPYKNLVLLIALSPGRCLRAGEPPLLCSCIFLTSRGETRLKPVLQLWRRELYVSFTCRQPPTPSILLPAHGYFLFFLLLKGFKPYWILPIFHPSQECVFVISDGSSCIVGLQIPQPASNAVTRELFWPDP